MSYKSKGSTFNENAFKQFVLLTCLASLWFVLIIYLLQSSNKLCIVCAHICLNHLK